MNIVGAIKYHSMVISLGFSFLLIVLVISREQKHLSVDRCDPKLISFTFISLISSKDFMCTFY